MVAATEKKIWTWQSALQDHLRIMLQLPLIVVAPFVLTPKEGESLMLAVNSSNSCPYCTSLHGELGRMAGLDEPSAINVSATVNPKNVQECQLFVRYGRIFGSNDGRGKGVEEEYQKLAESRSYMVARCARALAFFLMWGSLSGNTINAFLQGTLSPRGEKKKGSNIIFEIVFVAWYGVCFTIIVVFSALLSLLPNNVPKVLSTVIGVTLAFVASIWIIPLGLMGAMFLPFHYGKVYSTLPATKARD
jgi:AhpD family alkylhydroperoxidase